MVQTGTINPSGVLYAGLSLAAKLLKPHVVLMESINSLLKRVAQDSPNISLELLSARVMLKKHVGFTADEDSVVQLQQNPSKADMTITTAASAAPGLGQGTGTSGTLSLRVQPKVTKVKSFKQIKPFALKMADRLKPLVQDVNQWVQRMDRWSCPPALKEFEPSNSFMLNAIDRPFSMLPQTHQKQLAAAAYFHRIWFREHVTAGQLALLAFCNRGTASTRARGKKSLLVDVVRGYFVGEVHSMQVSAAVGTGGDTLTFCFKIICMFGQHVGVTVCIES